MYVYTERCLYVSRKGLPVLPPWPLDEYHGQACCVGSDAPITTGDRDGQKIIINKTSSCAAMFFIFMYIFAIFFNNGYIIRINGIEIVIVVGSVTTLPYLSIYLSIFQNIYLSIYLLTIYLSIYLSNLSF